MQLISETKPIARKSHRCENCGHMIPKGTRYLRQFCVDGGDVWSWVTHQDCMDAARYLAKLDDHDCYEGIPPIRDYEGNSGVFPDYIRGRFPHVICRLELSKHRRDMRRASK